ncbi:hypothetical protein [Alkalimarinus sediminis]|uniref:Uncharacterized protein n=1 Tax=Alkalimarinus sediminis TaxID=1632866 RepID=A0A9E8KQB4_9ALTE|nr:hypothetical protein [Alkalimarinus sediminis]UZW74497.1 hypothetical protein NNL22_15955 [Alkalimarinus sediminis]
MKKLLLKTKLCALPLIALLLGSLFVMSAYIPEKDRDLLVYDSQEEFIKTLVLSAFRLD